jgi:diphosphomevalonate decarboxylase
MKEEPAESTAVSHPNIALAKYWGKLEGGGNYPAVPSLSVTLAGMSTRTRVRFDGALTADEIVLNGAVADQVTHARAITLLDRVRAAGDEKRRARVESVNDFPTASGLASSASGFAALALAATHAAQLDWSLTRVSDLARQSSASAARSLFGGFVELDAGGAGGVLGARPVVGPEHLDLAVLVCVTTEEKKSVGSTDGMTLTARVSPYYAAWLEEAPRLCAAVRTALLGRDFVALGELAERSALAMHACALAAGIAYVRGATLLAMREVQALRTEGIAAFFTIDAGPHLKVLVSSKDEAKVSERLARVPGVLRIIPTRPGEGAQVS